MTRGRKPLPPEILNLRGTDRRDRQRPSSVMGTPVQLEDIGSKCQVSGLKSATRRAREIYWAVVRRVAVQGMMEEAFCSQLLFYAIEYDHFLTCSESIKKEGIYIAVEGKNGTYLVPNPAVKQREAALEKLLKIGSNFGFSPVDRQRLKIPVEDGKDKKLKGIVAMLYADDDGEDGPDEQ